MEHYPSDLSDKEWEIIKPFVEYRGGRVGRPRQINTREVINAILYVNKTGCQWRYLPKKYPFWKAVHKYLLTWRDNGLWQKINDMLRERLRELEGKNKEPSASIIDSQSVKTVQHGFQRGYDAGKKIKGRKRHIAVDTLGLLLMIVVHSAGIQDRVGAKSLLIRMAAKYRRLCVIFADGGYTGTLITWCFLMFHWTIKIIKRNEQKSFKILPKRWIVERTFGWLNFRRRLSKDYEHNPRTSEAMVYVSMIHLMLKRFSD